MESEPHYRFCKKSLISGKRINTLPVFGVSRNEILLVGSGQDSVVLAQAFESLRFPLEQGESFSDLSCLTCARQPVRLASSVSNSTSPCNERTWNAKGTDTIMTSPEHEAPKTCYCTKRSTALRSPTGIFAFASAQFPARPKSRSQAPQDICRGISFGIHRVDS